MATNLSDAMQQAEISIKELDSLLQNEIRRREGYINALAQYKKINDQIRDLKQAKQIDINTLDSLISDRQQIKRSIDGVKNELPDINPITGLIDNLIKQLEQLKSLKSGLEKIDGQAQQIYSQASLAGDPQVLPSIIKFFDFAIQQLSNFQNSQYSVSSLRDESINVLRGSVKAMQIVQKSTRDSKMNQQVEVFGGTLERISFLVGATSDQKDFRDLLKICTTHISYVRDLVVRYDAQSLGR
jgi:Tfp pilus assembly protein PilO